MELYFIRTAKLGVCFAATIGMAALAAVATPSATATTIVSDTFTTSNAGLLNGQSPNTGPAGATWVTHGQGIALTSKQQPTVNTTANTANFPGGYTQGDTDASIAFTPAASGLLSYTVTEDFASGSFNALGFANSASTADPFNQASLWVLAGQKNGWQLFAGTVATGMKASGTIAGTVTQFGTHTITLTYDPTSLVANLYFDGSNTAAGTYTLGSAATINSIFIANRNGTGSFSNIQLTQAAVPEPATLGLMAACGIGLLAARRRKTS